MSVVGRGRPLNPANDRAIFEATVEIATESGLNAVNIGAVSRRAGVSRPTIYRRFSNTRKLLEACITHILETQLVAPARLEDPREQTIELLSNTIDMLTKTSIGKLYRAAITHLESDPELTRLISSFGASRRKDLNNALAAAQRHGGLDAEKSIQVVGDALVGAIYFRFLMTQRRLDRRYVEELYDNVCGPRTSS